MSLVIRVNGRPAPQGSKHRGAHGQMLEASPYLPAWRAAVRNTAHRTLNAFGIPVEVRPHFRGAVVVRRLEFVMLPEQPLTGQPDLDKLTRGVFDALTKAGVWEDDARVVLIEQLSERHPHPGEAPGCIIEMESLKESENSMSGTKLYRLVLEEVEQDERGTVPTTIGQVVGDAAMVEATLPALAQRLSAVRREVEPREVTVSPAEQPVPQPAPEAPTEVKRGRGRPRKAQPTAPTEQPAVVAPPANLPGQGTYDPFAQVAGQQQ